MKYSYIGNGNNGLGLGVRKFTANDTDYGRKEFDDCTDIKNENAYKVATNKDGEALVYSEEVVAKIANDAADMSGKPRTKRKVSSAMAMEV